MLEVKGKTVEEAIQNGLRELDLTRNQVDVTVFDEGSKGFLGFGVRPARVLLTEKPKRLQELQEKMEARQALEIAQEEKAPKAPEKPATAPKAQHNNNGKPAQGGKKNAEPVKKPAPAPEKPQEKPVAARPAETEKPEKPAEPAANADKPAGEKPAQGGKNENRRPRRERQNRPEGEKRQKQAEGAPEANGEETENRPSKPRRERENRKEREGRKPRAVEPRPVPTGEPSPLSDSAKAYLDEIVAKMGLQAASEAFENADGVFVNLSGEDVGSLIGYRGETLDALQYLVSLHINKGEENYHRVLLDAENYRGKREETLIRLAHHLASKAVRSGRKVSLEPMNPYERRILHSALQDDNRVRTHSEGDEPYRRVVITPKRSGGNHGAPRASQQEVEQPEAAPEAQAVQEVQAAQEA